MSLQKWAVVVAGGASGLGMATCEALVKEGAKVCILDIDVKNGEEVQKQLGKQNAIFICSDVCSEKGVSNAFKTTHATFGEVKGLVNCAGILSVEGPTFNPDTQKPHSLEEFRKTMEVNVTGYFNTCRIAAATMSCNTPNKDGQRGVIVNLASIAGLDGSVNFPAYCTSKAAIAGMTLPMARDLAAIGVRVMAIAPAYCNTPLFNKYNDEVSYEKAKQAMLFPKRIIESAEVAKLIIDIFNNGVLNGETIRIDCAMRIPKTIQNAK